MRARDTSEAAARVQIEIYRRLTPEQRVELAIEMSEAARETSRGGIRSRHPEYDELEVEHALRRLLLGDDLYRCAWPNHPLLDP